MPTENDSTQAPEVEDYVKRFQSKTWTSLSYREGDVDTAVKWLERITDPKVTVEEAQALMGKAFDNGRERNASIIRFLMAVIQRPSDVVLDSNYAFWLTMLRGAAVETLLKGGLLRNNLSDEKIDSELDPGIVRFLLAQELDDPDQREFDYVSALLEFEPRDFDHTTDEEKTADLQRYGCVTAMVHDLLSLVERGEYGQEVDIWPNPDRENGCTEAEIERRLAVVKALEELALGSGDVDRSRVASSEVLEEHPWAAQYLILYYAQRSLFLKDLLDECAKELSGVALMDYKNGKPLSEIVTAMTTNGQEINVKAMEDELAELPSFR